MGNFTRPFPFLSPFSELCLALVQASCETWEYWVSSPAYVIPNVNASLTYIINCLHFTHYSLSCSFCSLTSCLTNKLELCSASKWSLRRPPWHSAAFPKPLQVIESHVKHRSTSIFSPRQCATLCLNRAEPCKTPCHPFIWSDEVPLKLLTGHSEFY